MIAQVGIVVIGRNEGDRLAACLAALGQNCLPIVYADSASNEGSSSVAAAAGATIVNLDPLQAMRASRGRSEGAQCLLADHPDLEYIQFIDGDCVIQPDWLETAASFLDTHPNIAGVCGRRFEAHPEASACNRMSDAEWNTTVGEVAAISGEAMMRVSAYVTARGFDPTIMAAEDSELCFRMRAAGWRFWRIDVPMTEHNMAMTGLAPGRIHEITFGLREASILASIAAVIACVSAWRALSG